MSFAAAFESFLEAERKASSGERLARLRGGLGHAEQVFVEFVWWPTFGNLLYLHPEYEVTDFGGGSRYIDFAYIRGGVKLAIEIDGFNAHVKGLDREAFAYRLNRQNMLVLDGWDVLRFSYDDVQTQPRRCQQALQQYMGTRFVTDPSVTDLNAAEREILRLARGSRAPVRPTDVVDRIVIGRETAYRLLRGLVERGWLAPASGQSRIRAYRPTERTRNAPF